MAGINGFNPHLINQQQLNKLAQGKGGAEQARSATGTDSTQATAQTKPQKHTKKGEKNDGVQLSQQATEAARKQEMTEKGEMHDIAHKTGNHELTGDYETPDDQDRRNEIAREDVSTEGKTFTTKTGESFKLDPVQTERIESLTDDKNLDPLYDKLLGQFSDEQVDAANRVFDSQVAQKNGSVKDAMGVMKPAPPEIAKETAQPVLEAVPTAGPLDIRESGNDKSQPMSIALPDETEAMAKEFAKRQALSGGNDEAFVAGTNNGVSGTQNLAGASKAEATQATAETAKAEAPAPLTEAQAADLAKLSEKQLNEATQASLQSLSFQRAQQLCRQQARQLLESGQCQSPDQARQAVAGMLSQNGEAFQAQVGQECQSALQNGISQYAEAAKKEAASKGVNLSDQDASVLGNIRLHKEALSAFAQKNKLSELMGGESGIPDSNELVNKHMKDGKLDAGAFSSEMRSVFEKTQPKVAKKIADLEAKAAETNDPKEKMKLYDQADALSEHLSGYYDAMSAGAVIEGGTNLLNSKEVIATKGVSQQAKALDFQGEIRSNPVDPARAGYLQASNDAYVSQQNAFGSVERSKEDADELNKNVEKKALDIYNQGSDNPKSLDEAMNDPAFAEAGWLAQAGELAGWASRQLASVDPNSERGQQLNTVAKSGLAYIESREAYIESMAPGTLKSNPQWQAYKSEWGKARAGLQQ